MSDPNQSHSADDFGESALKAKEPTELPVTSPMPAQPGAASDEIVFGRAPVPAEQSTDRATTGFRGLLTGLGIRMKPSSSEVAQKLRQTAFMENQTKIRQATWTRAVSVLVANPKGGAGKTPTSLCLAGVLAALRGNVVVCEVSDDPGKLLFRAEHERTPDLGLGQLVRDVDRITTAGQLAGYTALQTTRAHVVGTPGRRPPLDGAAVRQVMAKLDEFYSIRVMDSGNQYTSSAFVAALEVTDVLVIPITAGGDAATDAGLLLDELRDMGGHAADLARTAVVVRLIDGRTEHEHVLADIDRMLDQYSIEHRLTIPYDQHIADRQQITFDRLADDTKEAFTALGATVVRQLQRAPAPRPAAPNTMVVGSPGRGHTNEPYTDEVDTDELADTPAPVLASASVVPVMVPDVDGEPVQPTPVDSWVTCPGCNERVQDAVFCSKCGHQLAAELNLEKLYSRGRRAAGYAEPAESLRNHLTPVVDTTTGRTGQGDGRSAARS